MENRATLFFVLSVVLCMSSVQVRSQYNWQSKEEFHLKERMTHLKFYLFDILSGNKPTAVEVARPKVPVGSPKSATPFGHVYAVDDVLREGPDANSTVIGNAQGLYMSSSLDDNELSIMMYIDFGFTSGKFKGSSFSVFSRNPVSEGGSSRELAVVGGRGQFRMARGYVKVRTHYLNTTNGDAILEYKVILIHYFRK